jgi:hypothetical protein
MLNHIFSVMRDVRREYTENNITESRIGKVLHLPADMVCNVRVDVKGLTDSVNLSIKFEGMSQEGIFHEIGTFPIPDSAHGILFAKFTEHVRYQLILTGEADLDVIIRF